MPSCTVLRSVVAGNPELAHGRCGAVMVVFPQETPFDPCSCGIDLSERNDGYSCLNPYNRDQGILKCLEDYSKVATERRSLGVGDMSSVVLDGFQMHVCMWGEGSGTQVALLANPIVRGFHFSSQNVEGTILYVFYIVA